MLQVLRRKTIFPPTSGPAARTWPTLHHSVDDRTDGAHGGTKQENGNGKAPTMPGDKRGPVTQKEQDKVDNQKRREALRDLVESWMDRLQLISVITTFFASTEASLLSIASPGMDGASLSPVAQLANIGIVGSLVVHSSAAIISFLAAFFLVRYKLKVASNEERDAEKDKGKDEREDNGKIVESPTSMGSFPNYLNKDQEKGESTGSVNIRQGKFGHSTDPIPGPIRVPTGSTPPTVWSSNPHIIQVGPFQNNPPTHLLRRCHALCVILTAVGFVLALMGILCFAWDRLPLSVSISASFCMGMCVLSGVFIVLKPYPPEGTSPYIYVFEEI